MELHLTRKIYSKISTISELVIVGTLFKCFAIEDTCRDLNRDGDLNDSGETKVYGETAIPAGRYELVLYNSPKHGPVPLLKNVPGFEYVEIHPGNWAKDSLGCILPGETKGTDYVGNSKAAFNRLMAFLKPAFDRKEKVFLTIYDSPVRQAQAA